MYTILSCYNYDRNFPYKYRKDLIKRWTRAMSSFFDITVYIRSIIRENRHAVLIRTFNVTKKFAFLLKKDK